MTPNKNRNQANFLQFLEGNTKQSETPGSPRKRKLQNKDDVRYIQLKLASAQQSQKVGGCNSTPMNVAAINMQLI